MKISKAKLRQLWSITTATVLIVSVVCFATGYYIGYNLGYNAGYGGAPKSFRIAHLVADIHQIAFFISFSRGYYEEAGIMPKRLEYVNGPAEMTAFAAGDIDAGYVGCVPALIAKAKGLDLVVVASANLEGSAIVAKPEIAAVPELNGRVVGTPGIGTIQDSLLYMVEEKFNITYGEVKRYMGPAGLPLDFEKGMIDAFIAWEPFCAEVVVKGIGHVIHTSHDILPNHQCCVFYVSGKIFKEQPDLAKKLIKAHVKAMNFAKNNPDDAMEIFADMTGKSMEVVKESWKRMVWDYNVNITSMKIFVDYLTDQGKINPKDIPNVDEFLNSLVDQELLKQVAEAAG